ncbi:hypothetical protein SELMODRAFT_406843 [Selaginella moellendorffii]|uniref:Uncharacterized protein n=1 Tax=Selaginella moellendorffii TaxID=88036 RepID=D8R345_SELML|nr:hypothetical protein SELMODRAFT_406843 [Selaginella moellendorffii]
MSLHFRIHGKRRNCCDHLGECSTYGRYLFQAENQLGREWTLIRGGSFIHSVTHDGGGAQANLVSQEIQLTFVDRNLVDEIWLDGRPCPPRVHDLIYAGVDVATKFLDARKKLSAAGATGIVITMLYEVACLFNVHAGDFPHSPGAYAPKVHSLHRPGEFERMLSGLYGVGYHVQQSQHQGSPTLQVRRHKVLVCK